MLLALCFFFSPMSQVAEDVVIEELGKKITGYAGSDLKEFC